MGTEVLLYAYGAVCVGMLIFNVVYGLVLRHRNTTQAQLGGEMYARMRIQFERIRRGDEVEPQHWRYMEKRMSRVGNLISFNRAMEMLQEVGDDDIRAEYLREFQPSVLYLANIYKDREDIQGAYFAYFLTRNRLASRMEIDSVQEIMVGYMVRKSLYCRVGAFQALCDFGSPEMIVNAIRTQDRAGRYLNEKILTEALVSFNGDHDRLLNLLWEEIKSVDSRTALGIMNYIRFKSGEFCPLILPILSEPGWDKELCLSAVRYFGRYPYGPALPYLLDLARSEDGKDWEYTAVAATALGSYRGQDVLEALVALMHSSNWYVRYNAAASLGAIGVEYNDLSGLMGGRDRYAREMMTYQLESRQLSENKEAAVAS